MIIDCHSHFGNDYYAGKVGIDDYILYCKKMEIDVGFLMPTPWPKYLNGYGEEVVSLIWEYDENFKRYYYSISNKKIEIKKNPYKDVNMQYYKELVAHSFNNVVKLEFVPLIHGTLDTSEYLEKLFVYTNPIAVKIHGFGSGFSPDELKPEVADIIRKFNLPIILHTSVYNYDYGYGADTKYWRNECHPMKWINMLEKYNLKGVLNHGACLNNEAFEKINKNDNLMIGLGPDLDISRDYFKVDIDKELYRKINYLNYLKKHVDFHKLLFDIDFNWNVDNNNLDFNQINRLMNVWNSIELEYILSINALNYYDADRKRLIKLLR